MNHPCCDGIIPILVELPSPGKRSPPGLKLCSQTPLYDVRTRADGFQSLLCLAGASTEEAACFLGRLAPLPFAETFLQWLVGASVTAWKMSW